MIKLHHSEALEFLNNAEDKKWDMIFMDPPDNLGLDYGGDIDDNRSIYDYYNWLEHLILKSMFLAPIVWISYYHKHDLIIKGMIGWIINTIKPSWECRTFIWRFTFGQYNDNDCGSGYRPIIRLSSLGMKGQWNVDPIRVESKRMQMGDPRAAGLRVPDDVWEFPRVVGNSSERRKWVPTQHPEALIERIVKLSIDNGTILELFTGSGTMIRVVKRLGYDLDTVELNENYIKLLRGEHPEIK